ncbi:MAG: aminoglycoside phosphotransferase, partial [Pseudomonadota bacterium]
MTDQDREAAKAAFLKTHGFERAVVRPLAADASSRSYARLEGAPQPALLMDAPLQKEAPPCPPTADETTRRGLGYNAMARLAGPRLEAFTALAQWLSAQGVPAPKVYAEDIDQGFAVIEDFGQHHLADVAADKVQEAALYRQALLLLRPLQHKPLTAHDLGPWPLQTYVVLALEAEADLF